MRHITLVLIGIFFVCGAMAQTPNSGIPHTPRFNLNKYRDKARPSPPGFSGDTVVGRSTATGSTAPTNDGLNGNFELIDSIMNVHSRHDSLIQMNYTGGSGAWFGNGATGALGITADTTLNSEINCTTLRIDAGVHVRLNGYRIFADSIYGGGGTACITDTGQNGNNGVDGGNGVCPTTAGSGGGTAGAALNSKVDGYLARDASTSTSLNGAGSVGTQSGNTSAGNTGLTQSASVGSAGAAGGTGGSTSGHTAGALGAAGTNTALTAGFGSAFYILPLVTNRVYSTTALSIFRVAGFSGGGSGGCGDNGAANAYGQGGGGGGAAAPGGYVVVSARVITGTLLLTAKGGKGGNGGKGGDSGGGGCSASCGAGGGGGGGGGTGGFVVVVCHSLATTITFSVAGGTGGTGGTFGSGSCSPTAGTDGSNGNTGKLFKILL